MKSIHNLGNRFDLWAGRFTFLHPWLAFLIMFIGMPIFILLTVSLSTMAIVFSGYFIKEVVVWIF